MIKTFIFLAALGLAHGAQRSLTELHPDCPKSGHALLPHEYDCTKFYYCEGGYKFVAARDCPENTEFSATEEVCIHPELANCQLPGSPTQEATTSAPQNSSSICPCEILENGCPSDFSVHLLLPHETSCRKFYYCVNGEKILSQCNRGSVFDPNTQTCAAAGSIDRTCEDEDSSSEEDPTTEANQSSEEVELLPNGCPVDWNIFKYLPHEYYCNMYYQCINGQLVERRCAAGTHFNPETERCDHPSNVDCTLLGGDASSEEAETTEEPETTTRPPMDILDNGCPVDGSIVWMVPHENDCGLFYQCVWGQLSLGACPSGLHFSPALQRCESPAIAGCVCTACGGKPPVESSSEEDLPVGNDPNDCDSGNDCTGNDCNPVSSSEEDIPIGNDPNECSGNDCNNDCTGSDCDNECTGNDCDNDCTGDDCNNVCTGDDCDNGCVGDNCDNNCTGSDCDNECTGNDCENDCTGDDCNNGCTGDDCDNECVGDNCDNTCTGSDCDNECTGNDCDNDCTGDDCNNGCTGDDCDNGCVGDNCDNNCTGSDCDNECTGNDCDNDCTGDDCNNGCTGDDCDNGCVGDNCDNTCTGSDCDNECTGNDCENDCTGNDCNNGCTGDDCDSGCVGDNCDNNCTGDDCNNDCTGDDCNNDCTGSNCDSVSSSEEDISIGNDSNSNECTGSDCDNECSGNDCNNVSSSEEDLPIGNDPNDCGAGNDCNNECSGNDCSDVSSSEEDLPIGNDPNDCGAGNDCDNNDSGCAGDDNNEAGCPAPVDPEQICKEECNVLPWAHEDCDKYWRCDGKQPILVVCNEGLHFNPSTHTCDFACNVGCVRKIIQTTEGDDGIRIYIPRTEYAKTRGILKLLHA